MTSSAISDSLTKVLEPNEQLKGFTLGWVGMSRFAIGATDKRLITIPISAFLGRAKEPQSIPLADISNVQYELLDSKTKLPVVGVARLMPDFPEATFSFTTPEKSYTYKITVIAGIGNAQEIFVETEKLFNAIKK